MYPKLNELLINKFQKLIEGKDIEFKNIVKLINNQSLKTIKSPFTNLLLKNSLMSKRFNIMKRNKQRGEETFKKEKKYLTFNEFMNLYTKDKYCNVKNFDKERANTFDEDNCIKSTKNNLFKNKKYIERKIKTEINNRNKNKNKKSMISIDNNNNYKNIINIRKTNSTIHYKCKKIKLENKIIQTTQNFSPGTQRNKYLNEFIKNKIKKNENIFKKDNKLGINNDIRNYNNTERLKSSIFLKYKMISIKNECLKNNNKYSFKRNHNVINIKNLSQKTNNKSDNLYKIDISNFPEKQIINSYNNKKNYKNHSINIFTLLSLKKH